MQYSDHSIYVHVYWSSNPRTLGRMSYGGGDVETKKCRYGVESISANWINGSMDQKPKIIDAKNHPKIQHAINPINSNKIVIFFMIKIHE